MATPNPDLYARSIELVETAFSMNSQDMNPGKVADAKYTFLKQYFNSYDPAKDTEYWSRFAAGMVKVANACAGFSGKPTGRHESEGIKWFSSPDLLNDPDWSYVDGIEVRQPYRPSLSLAWENFSFSFQALAAALWRALRKR